MDRPSVIIAHPSPDLYGSDRQLLASLEGLAPDQWRVVVVLPSDGPLVPEVRRLGHEVRFASFPVLRRGLLTPVGLVRLGLALLTAVPRLARLLRRERAAAVYVNTLTVPVWLLAAAVARVPALCHVHEAEDGLSRPLRLALYGPLRLADRVVLNSRASERVALAAAPRITGRTDLVYNGMQRPAPVRPAGTGRSGPVRLVLVGRLSARKGTDVAVAAARLLHERGRDVRLTLVGDAFPGYEAFVDGLRAEVAAGALGDVVRFAGWSADAWAAYDDADVVLVPSRVEPFGNVAVEALLSQRPLIASDAQGLAEIVEHGRTGLLVPPGDAEALATAVERLIDAPDEAAAMAATGRSEAERRFGVETYRARMAELVGELAGRRR